MCPDPKSDYWYCAAGAQFGGCRPKSDGPFPEEACDEQCTAVVPTGVPANIVVSEGTWAFSDFSGNFLEIIWCLFFLNLLSKFFGTKCGKHFQKKFPKKWALCLRTQWCLRGHWPFAKYALPWFRQVTVRPWTGRESRLIGQDCVRGGSRVNALRRNLGGNCLAGGLGSGVQFWGVVLKH